MKSTSKTNITLGVRSRMSNIRLSWEKCMSKCRLMFKLKYYQMSRWYPAANEHYLWFVWYRLKWYIDFTRFFIGSFVHPYKVICATERCSNLWHREREREKRWKRISMKLTLIIHWVCMHISMKMREWTRFAWTTVYINDCNRERWKDIAQDTIQL